MDRNRTNSDAAPTRRAVLTRAASGIALAASGLFLPSLLDEAEAKRPAHRLGDRTRSRKRRRRNERRNRRKRRNKSNKKRGNKNKDLSWNDGILFNVINDYSHDVFPDGLQAEFWSWDDGVEGFVKRQEFTVDPESQTTVHRGESRAFLWIHGRWYIYANNPPSFPPVEGRMVLGGSVDQSGSQNGQEWFFGNIHVGDTHDFLDELQGVTVALRRDPDDDDDHKAFTVWIGKGNPPFED